MNGSDATDGDRPVQVHGRWTVPATGPQWSLEATLIGARGEWVLHHDSADTATLLGWTGAELRAIAADDLVHPDDRDRLDEAVAVAGARRRPADFVPLALRILARDSRYWWTQWHLTETPAGSCALHGFDFLGPDPAQGLLVATWRWNVETDAVLWSPELLDIFALHVGPPASLASFLATVHDDDRDHVARRLRVAVRDGDPFRYTFRCPAEGTRERWFHAAGRCCVDAAGSRQVVGLVKYLNPPSPGATAERTIGSG